MGRRSFASLVCVAILLFLSACGDTEIAISAIRELFGSSAGTAVKKTLTREEVSVAARQVGVDVKEIEQVASDPSRTTVWRRAIQDLSSIESDPVRSLALGTACDVTKDVVEGKVDINDDAALQTSIARSLPTEILGLGESETMALREDTKELVEDLHAAVGSQNPEERAAASLACYTVNRVL